MCGISCAFNRKGNIDISFMEDMLERIKFRGREGTLFEISSEEHTGVFLGTNRLPITKPLHNKQPVRSKNKNLMLIMNAEIFNYRELAKAYGLEEILNKEYGDTIFLVEFIDKFGVEFVLKHINWEGAFIYLDKQKEQIVFARDHLGIKPLYYISDKDRLLMSSEIKGLVDYECQGIEAVEPGSVNFFDIQTGHITKKKWFRLESHYEKTDLSSIFKDAVELRIPEEKYAILLSGGLDSSLVFAVAKNVNKNFVAYTLCTPDSPDLPYARKLCEKNGIELIEVEAESCLELKEKIPKIVGIVESWQWQVINHSAPMDVLFERIHKDGIKVALTGEGADELFFGYEENSLCDEKQKQQERLRRVLDLHKTNCRRLDRMAMAYGIECRVPFLDKRMVGISLNYTFTECVSEKNNKLPLRKMGGQLLSKDFCEREKLSLAKGAGYQYGKDLESKNVFCIGNNFNYEMKEKKYKKNARYPIEEYLLDISYKLGYLKANDLLTVGI